MQYQGKKNISVAFRTPLAQHPFFVERGRQRILPRGRRRRVARVPLRARLGPGRVPPGRARLRRVRDQLDGAAGRLHLPALPGGQRRRRREGSELSKCTYRINRTNILLIYSIAVSYTSVRIGLTGLICF